MIAAARLGLRQSDGSKMLHREFLGGSRVAVIDNDLYHANNTLMLFGDAKQEVGDVVKQLTGEGRH